MFEAQLPRLQAGPFGSRCHQHSNQIVGKRIDPDLFLAHGGSSARQALHAESRFDVPKIKLDLHSADLGDDNG
jgi:hypothetical protein